MLMADVKALVKAHSVARRVQLEMFAHGLGGAMLATIIAILGLGMLDVSAFLALSYVVSSAWSAAIVAAADFVIAGAVLLIAIRSGPWRDIQTAHELRDQALLAIEADVAEIQAQAQELIGEMVAAKDSVLEVLHNPFDVAARQLLVPAVVAVLKTLTVKDDGASQAAANHQNPTS